MYTRLEKTFLQKRDSESAILNTYSHQLCWVSTNITEINSVLGTSSAHGTQLSGITYGFDPIFEFTMGGDLAFMPVCH